MKLWGLATHVSTVPYGPYALGVESLNYWQTDYCIQWLSKRTGDQLAEVPEPYSWIIYAILLRPLCNHDAPKQHSLLHGKGSNLDAYKREVIPIAQTTCHHTRQNLSLDEFKFGKVLFHNRSHLGDEVRGLIRHTEHFIGKKLEWGISFRLFATHSDSATQGEHTSSSWVSILMDLLLTSGYLTSHPSDWSFSGES